MARSTKMCLIENNSRVGKDLSYIFLTENSLKYGNALSLLLFNIAYVYATSWVQVNQDGFKLNGTYQLLVYADYVNILDRSVKEKAEVVLASKEIGLKVNGDKTKLMFTTRDQNAG